MPNQSAFKNASQCGRSDGRPRINSVISARQTGKFMKKHQLQLMFSASQPPTTGPNSGPSNTIRPNMVMPTGNCDNGRRVRIIVCAVGISAPPVKPWPIRPAIIMGNVCDQPHIIENAMKSAELASRKLRKPNTRVSHAASGIITISDIR